VDADGFYSPLIVDADGSLIIAGVPVHATYDKSTATASFVGGFVKGTKASGQITFTQGSFSGTITPWPGAAPYQFTGTLNVAFPAPSLENLIPINGILHTGDVFYIEASNVKWIAIGYDEGLYATSDAPYNSLPFLVETASGGFYLSVNGEYVAATGTAGTRGLALDQSNPSNATLFSLYSSTNGQVVLATTFGTYWTLGDNSAIVLSPQSELATWRSSCSPRPRPSTSW
jgi:hypothetical protein